MARTFIISASRSGLRSVIVTETGTGGTYMVANLGAEFDPTANSTPLLFAPGVFATGGAGTLAAITSHTRWDPTQAVNITLSGANNLTATAPSGNAAVRAVNPQSSGKYYWECTLTTTTGINVGICNGAVNLATQAATGFNSAYVNKFGTIGVNGGASGFSLGTRSSGDLIGIAVDLTAQLIWFRVGASGSWNATSGSSNDPATGVGGASFAVIAPFYQQFYPVAGLAGAADQTTANFGDAAFTGTVPSGFTSGWPSGTTTITNTVATQIGGSAWVTNTHAPFNVTQVGASVWVPTQVVAAYPAGVAGTGQVGSLSVSTISTIFPTGIASGEALGSPTFQGIGYLSPSGIASGQALGSPVLQSTSYLTPSGIASAGGLGSPIMTAAGGGLMIFRAFP